MSDYTIRKILPTEYPFLSQMLYEAIFVSEGESRPAQSIITSPDFVVYTEVFGRKGDLALVVQVENKLVGAIWSRIFTAQNPGYGFVDSHTPELGMAIMPEHRKYGIGSILLKQFLNC
jgi:[ribosomal protein S18]-alanine N-acetyltransferase